jgi:hypothetical protein
VLRAVVVQFAPSDPRTLWSPSEGATHIALTGYEYVDAAKRLPGNDLQLLDQYGEARRWFDE